MNHRFHGFDMEGLSPRERYKILSSAVIPRPIALVTTLGADCVHNAAPYSFFNVLCEEPPLVALGLQVNDAHVRKDTARNIAATGEFVVHLVDEPIAEAMNICAIDYPPDVSEIDLADFTLSPSCIIGPQRINEAPVALECRELKTLRFSARRDIVIGEVLYAHVREELMAADDLKMDIDRYRPIGRLFGGLYSKQRDLFDMPRMSVDDKPASGR